MNYYDARLRHADGRWDYTSANRRTGTRPVGYCQSKSVCDCFDAYDLRRDARPDCDRCGGTGWVLNPDYCGSHDTAEEGQCFARYLLDGWQEEQYGDWTGCEVCDAPTKRGLTRRLPLGLPGHALCDEHRTFEVLASLSPEDAGQMIASY